MKMSSIQRTLACLKLKQDIWPPEFNIPSDEAEYMYQVNWPDKTVIKKWLSKLELQEQYEQYQRSK